MLRRASLTFVLCALAFTAAAAAQVAPVPQSLLQHHRVFQGRAVDQIAVLLDLQAPANGWATAAAVEEARVEAALDWLATHDDLFGDLIADVEFTSGTTGSILTVSGPGYEMVIHLPTGPFFPSQKDQLMVGTIIRTLPAVSNGI